MQGVIPTLVEIRKVHVLSGNGRTADFARVRCPVHGRTVKLELCLACVESGGMAGGPGATAGYASCRHAAGAEVRPNGSVGPRDHTPVLDVMTADVLAVRADVSLEALSEVLLERGLGGAPVVDEAGRPIGVVSKTDLVERRQIAGDTGEGLAKGQSASRGRHRVELGPGVHVESLPIDSVADAMTRGSITLPEDAPVARAAALMVTRGVHRVLVVSDDGRLSGILTSSDIVRWVAERAGNLPARGGSAREEA